MGAEDRRLKDGFTLIEVLVVIVLLAVISAAIGAAFVVVLRSRPSVEARTEDARTYQGLVTWLPRDVASTPAKSTNIIANPGALACSGATSAPGDNLLELRWSESLGASSTTYVAAYRFEIKAGGKAVRRYTCSSDAGFGNTTSINVTSVLDAASANVNVSPSFEDVSISFTTVDGRAYVVGGQPILVEATSRNPESTLPPSTTPATNPPLVPCAVQFAPDVYGPQTLFTGNPANRRDKLTAAVTLTLTVTGDTCGSLTVQYNTGVVGQTDQIMVVGTNGTVILPKGTGTVGPKWTPNTVVIITAYDGSTPMDTATLEVIS